MIDGEWIETNSEPQPRHNHHPTVKPIALAKYLATLLLPPSAYVPRRLLVPFSGSGSEMIGGHQAGWEEITGIEMEEEYCQIAEARLAYWCKPAKQDFLFTL
jgi:site-specific DNA-methyltransferase (adenine-specific)